ncbi:TetR/AcrR family transcriptional regulator [Ihubacter sp. mB4P-1]|uniref:TetR/AcrR family transcriptional regulator n=1 Tax=Ihubacter sp. mB4P-1 TaxID=3242370 RepID=UPI00137B7BAE
MRQTPENVSPLSNEGRNSYVINHLTDALLTLLHHKSISDISISELCEKAGVGRASFYRNYTDKEDILRKHIHQLFSAWGNAYNQNDDKTISSLLQSMFTHFEDHLDFYRLLSERNLIYLLKDVILGICGPTPEDIQIEAYAKAFVAYTLYGWIEVWFQRGMQESAEEIANLFKMQGL